MMDVLRKLPNVHVYIDDIIVGSGGETLEERVRNHCKAVEAVLEALGRASITLKGAKSKMFVTEVKFCGHILSNGTRRAAPSKLEAVAKWEPEQVKTVTHMKSFLGLVGWYDIYIKDFAKLATPLTDATHITKAVNKRITWTDEMRQVFQQLKKILLDQVVLQIVDVRKGFIIKTDASGWAVGGVLEQEDENGKERPVAFFSRKLQGDFEKKTGQCGWSPREQETYALILCLEKFQSWIGNNFVVVAPPLPGPQLGSHR
jgi:hypothetical protein